VVLRETARRVGVSASAAYRHFPTQGDLLNEVRQHALATLAASVFEALSYVPAEGDPGELAVARFHAAAEEYIAFGSREPGLFNTAFHRTTTGTREAAPYGPSPAGAKTCGMLGALLDDLVTVGRMDPAWRPRAETAAWAAVHGFTALLADGLLQHLSARDQALARQRTIEATIAGLTRPR
jgi:AcrR family transcriptional regulator